MFVNKFVNKNLPWKTSLLVFALVGVSVVGPLTAYAAVTVIYPKSTVNAGVAGTPPIAFATGADYAAAVSGSVAANYASQDSTASFTVDLNALSGGRVTIDEFATATKVAGVDKYKLEIATAINYGGGLTDPEIVLLKIRLWTGGSAPTADGDAGVCGVLDLEAAAATATSGGGDNGYCNGATVKIQTIFELGTNSSGTALVQVRPTSVVFV